jgi:uncharacterized protein YdhG (YjbR/CyaY superfamily)
VSAEEVDEYLRGVEEPKSSVLEALRCTILEIVPDAEQVISYRVPAFRVRGKTVAGFAAFKNHLSYLPFSGSVLPQLADESRGLHDDEECASLSGRPAGAERPREEADRGAARGGPSLSR